MLRLFTGRENIDKERFIYDSIKEHGGETLVLVPDQYTLVAEEQALKYLDTSCLFNVEITSMNRLGLKILMEQGTESVSMIDKYGRFMLLSMLIREHAEDFDIFSRAAGKLTFTAMLNDFISEFKQQDCTIEELQEMSGDAGGDPILEAKLKELSGVITAYEEAIAGRYTDSEDYIAMYVRAIKDSKFIRGRSVWVYGYDSITPKFAGALMELAKNAESVSFIVNVSDFDLDKRLTASLIQLAADNSIDISCEEIPDSYQTQKSETIKRMERSLWKDVLSAEERAENAAFVPEDLTIVCAANPYYEAESAAAYVWHLIRDLGYRMREIQLIANDEGAMQPIIRRVFEEYGLPVFADTSRDITDSAAVGFIVNLLEFLVHRKSSQYLFAMLKTGLTDYDDRDIEDLENYARGYRIKGSMWDKPFKYGGDDLGEESFGRLESIRARISGSVSKLAEISKSRTVTEFIKDFIMGDADMNLAEFTDIYVAGLSDVEVGVIPPSVDGLSMGTMIRTRPRQMRAAVILGACEGVMPLSPQTEGLFSVDEKEYFKIHGFALGSLDDIKMDEENAAMYRMMARPSEKIYISWSMTDSEGRDTSPSPVIDSLRMLFPRIDTDGLIRKDIISMGRGYTLNAGEADKINTAGDGMRHLINRLKDANAPDEPDALTTRAMLHWYADNSKDELDTMLRAAAYDNVQRPLGRAAAKNLFCRRDGSLSLSASSIGNYIDCPFRYFIDRGLRPKEERTFASDARSVGDVYHECLMAVARQIMKAEEVPDDDSLEELVTAALDELSQNYMGGLFISTGCEEYRMSRIREICASAAKAMAAQLSAGSVISASFEEPFGRHADLEPLRISAGDSEVYVEGKIDRADIMDVGGEKRVRIIDYKTGSDKLDLWKMRQGYKMQLMIYLISATSGELTPAGMFYFNIKDPIESINDKSVNQINSLMDKEAADEFKLKGAFINEEGVLRAMPEKVLSSAKNAVSREAYEEIRKDVIARIEETAEGILDGKIGINPLRVDKKLACGYCSYRSVCRRDRGYVKNSYRSIKPKPKEK